MKSPTVIQFCARAVSFTSTLCLFAWLAGGQTTSTSSTTHPAAASTEEADKAWKEVQRSTRPPMAPAEWQGHPTKEQIEEFQAKNGILAEQAAEKAKDFYTRYPDHPKAAEARKKELEMLRNAQMLGSNRKSAELAALEEQALNDPKLSEKERLDLRLRAFQRSVMSKQSEGHEAMLAAEEKGARELIKDFPKRDEGYQILLQVASQSDGAKAKEIAKEIEASSASDQTKESAKGILRKMEALGKPLDIKFASVDGRDVDVAKMQGKVVLVDFWATWCGPCVAEVPNVKKTYDELHPKGFEIVGISFDQDKGKLEDFVKKQGMTWPQYFDGEGWGNKFGKQYGITGIPTMWLVDKEGNLRDMNARGGLEEKVQKLLKE